MDIKVLAELLGLSADATEEKITETVTALKAKPEELEAKLKELETKLAAVGEPVKTSEGEESENSQLRLRVIALETEGATGKAVSLVDAAIKAGKFVPAVRPDLIKMAVSDAESFTALAKNTPDNVVFAAGAKGSASEDSFDMEPYELSSEELKSLDQIGLTREEVILQKLADAGVGPPAAVLASLKGTSDKN